MNKGDTFVHGGVTYTVTEVISPLRIKAIGKNTSVEPGPKALPKIIEINIADIQA